MGILFSLLTYCICLEAMVTDVGIPVLQVNPARTKELTNVRAACKDDNVKLSPPRLVCPSQLY